MVSCFYSCPWTNPVSFLCWKHRNCVLLSYGKLGYHFNSWHSLNTELQYCWRSYVFFIVLFEFSCSLCMHIEHVNVIFFCHILFWWYILTIHERRLVIWWHLNHWYSMKPVYKACLPILHVSMYGTWLSDDVNKWCPSVAFCVCLFGVVSLFVLSCYKNPCIYKFIQKSMLLQ